MELQETPVHIYGMYFLTSPHPQVSQTPSWQECPSTFKLGVSRAMKTPLQASAGRCTVEYPKQDTVSMHKRGVCNMLSFLYRGTVTISVVGPDGYLSLDPQLSHSPSHLSGQAE
jgi:hypothetical protein